MMRSILTSAALVAVANAVGSAIVVNECSYDVFMANTPSADGGYSTISQTLQSGGSYSQEFTALTNGNGWSIKLAKTNDFASNLLQYEYTYQNDGTIWYDLSEVNGNPWDGNWEITATSGCTPRQAAYRYATDDAYGMQSCASTASITVHLCSGEGAGSAVPSVAPISKVVVPVSSTAVAPTTTFSTSTSSTSSPTSHHTWGFGGDKAKVPAGDAILATTSSSSTSSSTTSTFEASWDGPAVTVTNVHMATYTQYVTATAAPAKRHEHHPRHPHQRR